MGISALRALLKAIHAVLYSEPRQATRLRSSMDRAPAF